MSDEYAQVFRLLNAAGPPDSRKQCTMCHDLARVSCEMQQQVKFLRSQPDLMASNRDRSTRNIDTKIANFDDLFSARVRRRCPSQGGSNSCQELINTERLGDVVVGTSIERFHLDC